MIWAALLIGLMGSFHCLAMCGPIALALPVPGGKNRVLGILLYNTGRIIAYGFLGLLFGLIGTVFILAGLQQFLSIFSGLLMLGIATSLVFGNSIMKFKNPVSFILFSVKNYLGSFLKSKTLSSLFYFGLLNGLLPCGLVYFALVASMSSGHTLTGGYYMMAFGLGTVPMMFSVAYLRNRMPIAWNIKWNRMAPYIIGVMGLLLVLRGLNLGLPYLSPELSSKDKLESSCCEKPSGVE